MSTLCIIPARGGSKRIPHKNIREFLGKPIIAYSIEAALQSGVFEEVMVSTDDPKIAEVARQYGAQVPFMRSAAASSDYASTRDVLVEVLDRYAENGRQFDYLACVYPTAPFITPEKLRAGYEKISASDAGELMPVIQYSYPPQRAFVIQDGKLVFQYPEYITTRSQDLQPIYHDCGQFYFYRMETYLHEKHGSWSRLPLIVPEEEAQDIDNFSDWELAEIKYQKFIGLKMP